MGTGETTGDSFPSESLVTGAVPLTDRSYAPAIHQSLFPGAAVRTCTSTRAGASREQPPYPEPVDL